MISRVTRPGGGITQPFTTARPMPRETKCRASGHPSASTASVQGTAAAVDEADAGADDAAEEVEVGAFAGGEGRDAGGRGAADVGEERGHAGVEVAGEACDAFAGGGEGEAAAVPGVEGDAEGLGELPHLDVEGGLGDVEFLGRTGEAEVVGEDGEGGEGVG